MLRGGAQRVSFYCQHMVLQKRYARLQQADGKNGCHHADTCYMLLISFLLILFCHFDIVTTPPRCRFR